MSRRWLPIVVPTLIVTVLAVVAVWAYGDFGHEPAAPAPKPALPSDPCPEDRPNGEVRQPNEYTDRAAPYTGTGPHLMVLVEAVPGVNHVYQGYSVADRLLPAKWLAQSEDEKPRAQLIVCEYAVSIGALVRTCEYIGADPVRLLRAAYVYRVFEARTGKPVTEFTLDSGANCPPSIEVWNGGPPPQDMLQSTAFDDLKNALRPVVEA
jgi:hypothetical protein